MKRKILTKYDYEPAKEKRLKELDRTALAMA